MRYITKRNILISGFVLALIIHSQNATIISYMLGVGWTMLAFLEISQKNVGDIAIGIVLLILQFLFIGTLNSTRDRVAVRNIFTSECHLIRQGDDRWYYVDDFSCMPKRKQSNM